MSEPLHMLLRSAAAAQRGGHTIAACLIVSARGSTPQPAGALMFLDDTGRLYGTIGGGCLEAEVRRRAIAMLVERRSAILRFKLDHDYGWDDGLICGGTVEIAIGLAPPPEILDQIAQAVQRGEPAQLDILIAPPLLTAPPSDDELLRALHETVSLLIPPRPRLYIAGAGHIGLAVARHALALDFDTTLFDDRPDLLARAPRGTQTACGNIAQHFAAAPLDGNTWCLIVTRGHRHDQQALAAILNRIPGDPRNSAAPRYIGMIGSRRKVKVIFDDLECRGIPRAHLDAVHAPVGLAIGAVTVEEIAISIAAQLIQLRSQGGTTGNTVLRTPALPSAHEDHTVRTLPIGILLAAGRGTRMGRTKQLLSDPADPARSIVAAAFDAIAPCCRHMIVVVAHDAPAVIASLGERTFTPAHSIPGAEMSESLRAGLRAASALDPAAPILLHLADHPRLDPRTLEALLSAARDNPDRALIPTCHGRGGHPILIPHQLVGSLLQDPLIAAGGLRAWWKQNPHACSHLPVNDPGILVDLDEPGDYHALSAQRGSHIQPAC
jgi:xanthine dehydrogenase accessory factor